MNAVRPPLLLMAMRVLGACGSLGLDPYWWQPLDVGGGGLVLQMLSIRPAAEASGYRCLSSRTG